MLDIIFSLNETELSEFETNLIELINPISKVLQMSTVKNISGTVGFHLTNNRCFFGNIIVFKIKNDIEFDFSGIKEYNHDEYLDKLNENNDMVLSDDENALSDMIFKVANENIKAIQN
jgi:hypothetical protein